MVQVKAGKKMGFPERLQSPKDYIGYSDDADALCGSEYNRGTGCGKTARLGPWFKLKSFVLELIQEPRK
ncbi:MAG: hypothetical protein AB2L11_02375 [Syntrophobacteraceae bacterium]